LTLSGSRLKVSLVVDLDEVFKDATIDGVNQHETTLHRRFLG